jgi:prevent-host-death family protein
MRTFSSADAKNRFGDLIDAARIEPVAVTKYDKPFVVVMGIDEFERLKSKADIARKTGRPKLKFADK